MPRSMRAKLIAVASVLFFCAGLRTARACVCSQSLLNDRESAQAEFKKAAVVFEGEVSSPRQVIAATTPEGFGGLDLILFRVVRAYKGSLGDTVNLYDAYAGTDCDPGELKAGDKLFIYGFKGTDGKIYIQPCSRTTFMKYAGPDLRFARNEPPTAEDVEPPGEKWRLYRHPSLRNTGASLIGVVRRPDGADASGAVVTLWDIDETGHRNREGSVAARQQVEPDGSFDIRFLSPGIYDLTARDSNETYTARYIGDYGNVTLSQPQVLTHIDVTLHKESLGTVTVELEIPADFHDPFAVSLGNADPLAHKDTLYDYGSTIVLDPGKTVVVFDHVPYGSYEISASPNRSPSPYDLSASGDVLVQLNQSEAHAVIKVRRIENK
ncbi:MAG: carboxypeptidase-like regulatory domain-containing protein [Candidatus Acidiferrum sp.]